MTRPQVITGWAICLSLVSCQCGSRPGHEASSATTTAVTRSVAAAPRLKSAVGTNLAGIADWSTEPPFVDLFKSSRPWFSGNTDGAWDDGRTLDLDEHGWVRSLKPGQIARTLLLWDIEHYPKGKYVVLYEGKGTLDYGDRSIEPESRPGRHVLAVDPSPKAEGILLNITKTNSADPIRNIRVIMPGFERTYEDQIFNPRFLDRIRSYSVLRFMDWALTNNSTIEKWSDRPVRKDARWSVKGVPFEIMLELARRLEAEPWLTIPHRADDDYVRRLAQLARDRLAPGARVWVEYSNEVWNGAFDQHRDVGQCDAGKSQSDPYFAALVCYSKRSVEVFRVWREVFGEDQARVIRVLASHAADPPASEKILSYERAFASADVLAIAPYFGLIATDESQDEIKAMTLEQLLSHTRDNAVPQAIKSASHQAKLAARFGLPLVAYEGGQHFVGVLGGENVEAINELYDSINRDPRMKEIYYTYLVGWKEAGGQLLVHFTSCASYSKWGRFGALEYLGQPRSEAPKYDALQRFIKDHPPWWYQDSP